MVAETTREGETWYACEGCEMLFDSRQDAEAHEQVCDAEEPAYLQ
jgi:uncharacterized C2H2 Zn-finger protein